MEVQPKLLNHIDRCHGMITLSPVATGSFSSRAYAARKTLKARNVVKENEKYNMSEAFKYTFNLDGVTITAKALRGRLGGISHPTLLKFVMHKKSCDMNIGHLIISRVPRASVFYSVTNDIETHTHLSCHDAAEIVNCSMVHILYLATNKKTSTYNWKVVRE